MPPETHADQPGLSPDELANELATDLPEREALSIVDPGVFSVIPTAIPVVRGADAATTGDAGVQDAPPVA